MRRKARTPVGDAARRRGRARQCLAPTVEWLACLLSATSLMTQIQAGSVSLEYDTFGDCEGRPLLMVMGLSAQMIAWHEGFCELLAEAGHYVIRFDNRDCGLSEKFEHLGIPNVGEVQAAFARGETVPVPYLLSDMAADAFALLDALGMERAHVCGASMGGMIAQTMAILNQPRLASLISIMSATGDPAIRMSEPEALAAILSPPGKTREEAIERSVEVGDAIGSPTLRDPYEEKVARAARSYDRSFYPQGFARQISAITASGNRRPELEKLSLPTLVIHGEKDKLVRPDCARDTHEAIKGSKLCMVDGMGHDLPTARWSVMVEAIAEHTRLADA